MTAEGEEENNVLQIITFITINSDTSRQCAAVSPFTGI